MENFSKNFIFWRTRCTFGNILFWTFKFLVTPTNIIEDAKLPSGRQKVAQVYQKIWLCLFAAFGFVDFYFFKSFPFKE